MLLRSGPPAPNERPANKAGHWPASCPIIVLTRPRVVTLFDAVSGTRVGCMRYDDEIAAVHGYSCPIAGCIVIAASVGGSISLRYAARPHTTICTCVVGAGAAMDIQVVRCGYETLIWTLHASSLILSVYRTSPKDTAERCVVVQRNRVETRPFKLVIDPRSSVGQSLIVSSQLIGVTQGLNQSQVVPTLIRRISVPDRPDAVVMSAIPDDRFVDACFHPTYTDVVVVALTTTVRFVDVSLDGRFSGGVFWCTRMCGYTSLFAAPPTSCPIGAFAESLAATSAAVAGDLDDHDGSVPALFSLDSDDKLTAWYHRGSSSFDSFSCRLFGPPETSKAPSPIAGLPPQHTSFVMQNEGDPCAFAAVGCDQSLSVWLFDVQARMWQMVAFCEALPKLVSLSGHFTIDSIPCFGGFCDQRKRFCFISAVDGRVVSEICVSVVSSNVIIDSVIGMPAAAEDPTLNSDTLVWVLNCTINPSSSTPAYSQVCAVSTATAETVSVVRPAQPRDDGGAIRFADLSANGKQLLLVLEHSWEVWNTITEMPLTVSSRLGDDVVLVAWSPILQCIDADWPCAQCVTLFDRQGRITFADVAGCMPAELRGVSINRNVQEARPLVCAAIHDLLVCFDTSHQAQTIVVKPNGVPSYCCAMPTIPRVPVNAVRPALPTSNHYNMVLVFSDGSCGVWDVASRACVAFLHRLWSLGPAVGAAWVDESRVALLSGGGDVVIVGEKLVEDPTLENAAALVVAVTVDEVRSRQGQCVFGAGWGRGALSKMATEILDSSATPNRKARALALLCGAASSADGKRVFATAAEGLMADASCDGDSAASEATTTCCGLSTRPLDLYDILCASRDRIKYRHRSLALRRAEQARNLELTAPLSANARLATARGLLRVRDAVGASEMLLSCDHTDSDFEKLANLACAIALSIGQQGKNSVAELTARRAAAKHIVADRCEDAVDKYTLVGDTDSACEALIAKQRFADAIEIALLLGEEGKTLINARLHAANSLISAGDYASAARLCVAANEWLVAAALLTRGAVERTVRPAIAALFIAFVGCCVLRGELESHYVPTVEVASLVQRSGEQLVGCSCKEGLLRCLAALCPSPSNVGEENNELGNLLSELDLMRRFDA